MKYIDSEKLISEIEREVESSSKKIKSGKSDEKSTFCRGEITALYTIKSIISSLQQEQPEVDLEKEWKSYMESRKDDLSGNAVTINMKDLARHFFELGLNAGREKSNGVDGVVHHALKSHWIVTDKNKLAAILKEFPEGSEVELFVCAKRGEKWK